MSALTLVLPETIFTRALFDGSVKVESHDVAFAVADTTTPASSARLRGRIERHYAGGEQVITDYLVRLSRGIGQPLVAIPVFLARGMVHRKYVGRRDGPAPTQLSGKRIGVSRLLAASAVHLRGILSNEYGLTSTDTAWITAEPFASDDSLATDWPPVRERLGMPAPRLLDRLAAGELDAVLYPGGGGGNWYEWVQNEPVAAPATSHYQDLATAVRARPGLEFAIGEPLIVREWFLRNQVYPMFHMVAVHAEHVQSNPGLPAALTRAFSLAANAACGYLSKENQKLYEREIEWLGVDPNETGLTALNSRSVEYAIDVLQADGMIERRPSLKEIFPFT